MTLSERFQDALTYATQAYSDQTRKGTDIPCIAHVLGVTAIGLEHGATEDEAIAALLHDVVEGAGGKARLEDIRTRFGTAVADIVEGCSDTDVVPKPPWRKRKEEYIEHIKNANASTILVSAADKLHNARSILADYRVVGEDLWSRFNGGKQGTLWYYRSLAGAFDAAPRTSEKVRPLIKELDRVVWEIERLSS